MRCLLPFIAVLALAAAPAPVCQKTGKPPQLNGDPFSPVECSTTPKAALPLPVEPAAEAAPAELKALKGKWEGVLIKGFGRYAVTLEVKPGWGGKTDVRFDWKEQQTRQTGWTSVALTAGKAKGAAAVALKAGVLPDAVLAGEASFSAETDKAGATRSRLDTVMANGARHRLRWSLAGKDALRFSAAWAVPEAPVQTLDGELKRAK